MCASNRSARVPRTDRAATDPPYRLRGAAGARPAVHAIERHGRLIGAQLLDGVGSGIFGAITPLLIANVTRGTGRYNVAQDPAATVQGVGASLSGLAVGEIVDRFGDTAAFLESAAAAAVALAVLAWKMHETARSAGKAPDTKTLAHLPRYSPAPHIACRRYGAVSDPVSIKTRPPPRTRSREAEPDLGAIRAALIGVLPEPSGHERGLLDQLERLADRRAAGRFQLAVVGQFKRGKSSLLNALLGIEIMPMGIVPVTAIPTFVAAGDSHSVSVVFSSRPPERHDPADAAGVRATLEAYVTEAGNPSNERGVARVDVKVHSALLAAGVVLIDTPGVGSTLRHNSDAAEAVLPECDAALFVVSPDPPITEVEFDYLARLRAHVARVIVVLNKIDLVNAEERAASVAFLRETLERAGLRDADLFCVSARAALRALTAGDAAATRDSGIPALERHLRDFLAAEKTATLERAVALKADRLLYELRAANDLALCALELPLGDLAHRLTLFDAAVRDMDAQRRSARDLLAGDRARALAEIDDRAAALRNAEIALAAAAVDTRATAGKLPTLAWRTVADALPARFAAIFDAEVAGARSRFSTMLAVHAGRSDALLARVRQIAASVMGVTLPAALGREAFEVRIDPYWVTRPTDSLLAFAPGALDRLLPPSLRRSRERRRVQASIEEVIRRNVENLRWALHQSLVEAFHAAARQLDLRYEESRAATRGMIGEVLARRHARADAVADEIERRRAAAMMLADAAAGFRAGSENALPEPVASGDFVRADDHERASPMTPWVPQ